MMKRFILCLPFILTILTACKEEETPYPAIISVFANVETDATGTLWRFVTDKRQVFQFSNPQAGYRPDTTYRAVCGYVPEGEYAWVYQLEGALLLKDSTANTRHDPIDILSAWRTTDYVNMHLSPRTQGGRQFWGFCIDSLKPGHCFLSLHHNQGHDAVSYNQSLYASIHLNDIAGLQKSDTISWDVMTFKGTKRWTLPPTIE
jgi:hypothetical protein